MAKFTPKVRPDNLPVAVTKGKKPPFECPTDPADKPTFEWLEKLRDHHEKNGELLTIEGMYDYARGLFDGDELDGLKKQINQFYKAGNSAPAKATKPTPKAEKAKSKEKTMVKTAAPVKKTNGKSAPAKATKNGKANPKASKSSPAPKVKPTKKAAPKAAPPVGKTVLEKSVNGLDVLVRQVGNSFRGTINGYPMRGILRMMGAKNKTAGEARTALARIMKSWKGGEDYAAAMVEEGHVGSGAREASGEKGSFGPAPEDLMKDKKTVQSLLSFCK